MSIEARRGHWIPLDVGLQAFVRRPIGAGNLILVTSWSSSALNFGAVFPALSGHLWWLASSSYRVSTRLIHATIAMQASSLWDWIISHCATSVPCLLARHVDCSHILPVMNSVEMIWKWVDKKGRPGSLHWRRHNAFKNKLSKNQVSLEYSSNKI